MQQYEQHAQAQDYDANLDNEIAQYEQQQAQQSSGVSRALIYVGLLVVVNIVLIAVDAPFYIY